VFIRFPLAVPRYEMHTNLSVASGFPRGDCRLQHESNI
jgi:hypothetical protein